MKRGADLFIGIALALGVIVEVFLSLWQVLIQQSVGGFFYFLGERSFSTTTPGIANASLAGQLFLRPYGTFSHPNILAGYFLVVSFLLIFLSQKTRRNFMKGLLCVVAGLGFLGCILTLSRVAIVGLFIGVVVLIHKNLSSAVRTAAVILIAFGGILFFVSLFYPEVIIRFLPGSYGQSVSERVMLAQASLAMIKHVPLFGVGLGAFLPSLPYFSIDSLILQPVHNIYLLIASEAGMVGISVFIFFLWEVLQKTLRKQLLLVCLFSILFTGMFDHYWLTIQQGQLLFGFLIGACLHESHAGGTIQR